jgi:hypothetical protein
MAARPPGRGPVAAGRPACRGVRPGPLPRPGPARRVDPALCRPPRRPGRAGRPARRAGLLRRGAGPAGSPDARPGPGPRPRPDRGRRAALHRRPPARRLHPQGLCSAHHRPDRPGHPPGAAGADGDAGGDSPAAGAGGSIAAGGDRRAGPGHPPGPCDRSGGRFPLRCHHRLREHRDPGALPGGPTAPAGDPPGDLPPVPTSPSPATACSPAGRRTCDSWRGCYAALTPPPSPLPSPACGRGEGVPPKAAGVG